MSITKTVAYRCSDGYIATTEEDAISHECTLFVETTFNSSWPVIEKDVISTALAKFPHEIETFLRNLIKE